MELPLILGLILLANQKEQEQIILEIANTSFLLSKTPKILLKTT